MPISSKAFTQLVLKNRPPTRIILTKEEQLEKAACEASFYEFCKASWPVLYPFVKYIDGWHIKAICDHFQAFLEGRPGVKVLNIPPRHMKSTIKVMYGAWVWIHKPWYQLMYISADADLVIRDHMQIKDIIKSKWYQKYWGDRFKIRKDKDGKEEFGNNKGGASIVRTIKGSITGHSADIILCDDINSQNDIYHTSFRKLTTETFDNAISTRLNDPQQSFIVNIQQRLCEGDATDHILKTRKNVTHICIPLEKEEQSFPTIVFPGTNKLWIDPRKTGELLWPQRFNRTYVENVLKPSLRTKQNIAAQLQQKPSPDEGIIFLKEYFNLIPKHEVPPLNQYDYIIHSVDPAVTNSIDACYSASIVLGIYKKNHKPHVMLLWAGLTQQGHEGVVDWIKQVRSRFYYDDAQYKLVLETAGIGKGLHDTLTTRGIHAYEFDPRQYGLPRLRVSKDGMEEPKVYRAKLASPYFADGLIGVPLNVDGEILPHLQNYIDLLCKFPTGTQASFDYADCTSQAILWMGHRSRQIIEPIELAPILPQMDWKAEHERMQAEEEQGFVDSERIIDNRRPHWIVDGVLPTDIFAQD